MLIAKVNCKMAKQAIFLIILCLNSCSTFSAKTEKCDDNTTKTTGGTAYWKFRGVRYTTSEDYLCWKENWELFLRECNTATGQWHPENVVCQEQEETNQYCPEELIEIHGDNGDPLCLHISPEPQKYDDAFCRGSNVVVPSDLSKDQMSNLVQFLQKRKIKEYWLPLRRENNTMPFKIRLPGKHWGEIYDDGVETLDFTSNRCCMSAQYDSKAKKKNKSKQKDMPEMKIQDCEALLHSICIFQDELVTGSGCPQGFGALSYRPNECYGVNWSELEPLPEGRTQISIKEYFRNRNTLRRVLKKSMPKKMRDEFFQVDNFVSSSGDNYMILMNQNERVKVADKSSEIFPILHKEVVDIAPNTVQLILKIDVQKLILIVYNRGYLWRTDKDDAGVNCFTNSGYDLVQSTKVELKWESESQAKSIFKVKLVGDGPGEYWCEGHTIQNFNLVSTTRVVAVKERRGHAYAIRLSVPCELEIAKWCDNVHKNAKRMAKHIREVLREGSSAVSRDLIIFNVRIMSIEKTAPEHVDCWIHLTASLKHSAVDNSEEESGEEENSLENDEHIRHDTSIRMQIWMLLRNMIFISVYNPSSPSARIVRSTEYCFPETFHSANGEVYQWNQAARGQMGTLSRLCLQSSGLPYMRQCQGDFLHGAHWEELEGIVACQHEQENTSITKTLYSLEHSKLLRSSPEMAVREVKSILKKYASNISPADIHFTANILQSSVKYIDQHVLGLSKNISALKDTTHDLIAIYNFMVDVKKTTIQMSASLNSTNKLLEAFENAMNTLSSQAITEDDGPNRSAGHGNSAEMDSSTDFEVLDFVDIGVTLKASHNLLYFILNPTIANVSGIAVFKYDNSSENSNQIKLKGAFQMESVNFLQSTHDVTDFINKDNLQFATYVPEKLLTHLDTISNALNVTEKHETIIVIKVYSNDILFQQQNSQDHRSAFGRVVSISLPGHSSQLPEDLPLVFRAWRNASLKDNSSTKPCSYWNFENWVSDGIRVSSDPNITQDIVFCQVSHLTPFAYLVGFNFTVEDDIGVSIRQVHAQALDIITIIGCSLSLLGISGIFITAAKFQSWRQKASSKVLLQLSASIALQMVILCFVSTKENSLHLIINEIISSCVAIGALLHYSVLVQFFWMMVIAYLQFKRYVQVFGRTRPTRFFIKSTAFCWGVPLIPVILVALLDHDSFSKGSICYPSGYALYFGIILPICVIIIANFIIFCLIIYNILLSSNPPIRHTEKPVLMYQIRLSVLLFFLLGFTWCFGILTIMKAGLIFSYFFCLTATLQGFVIFLYFIILDPVTRRMWSQYFYKLCSIDKGALQSTTSLKDTTQTS